MRSTSAYVSPRQPARQSHLVMSITSAFVLPLQPVRHHLFFIARRRRRRNARALVSPRPPAQRPFYFMRSGMPVLSPCPPMRRPYHFICSAVAPSVAMPAGNDPISLQARRRKSSPAAECAARAGTSTQVNFPAQHLRAAPPHCAA